MNAIDTNVFVYAHDADEPAKQATAITLLDGLVQKPSETVMLWQVAGELLSCLRRWKNAGKMSAADAEASFRDALAMFPLRMPKATVFDLSLELCQRYSLSHWDSMLLAACIDAGVDTLYTEDMDAATTYDGLALVNPFA